MRGVTHAEFGDGVSQPIAQHNDADDPHHPHLQAVCRVIGNLQQAQAGCFGGGEQTHNREHRTHHQISVGDGFDHVVGDAAVVNQQRR